MLPGGVFVWRDEFEHEYRNKLQREWTNLSSYRSGDDDINFTPMLPDTTRTLVFEGFEGFAVDNPSNHPVHRQLEAAPTPDARYTLEEAAKVLSDETNERYEQILPRLMSAAEAGSLPTYEPGKRLRYTYGPSGSSRGVRKFYEEAYWSDITAWLEKSEPRVTFQSPKRAEIIASESTPRDATHVGPKERPQQKQRWQEEQILQAMRDLGISPMALPKRRPGVAGVKADVRERLGDLHWTPSVFDKAWERLRMLQLITMPMRKPPPPSWGNGDACGGGHPEL